MGPEYISLACLWRSSVPHKSWAVCFVGLHWSPLSQWIFVGQTNFWPVSSQGTPASFVGPRVKWLVYLSPTSKFHGRTNQHNCGQGIARFLVWLISSRRSAHPLKSCELFFRDAMKILCLYCSFVWLWDGEPARQHPRPRRATSGVHGSCVAHGSAAGAWDNAC